MSDATNVTAIAGGTVLTPPHRIEQGIVRIRDGAIVDVDRSDSVPPDAIDASGKYVLPGFVDLHGDDVERELAPRPEARVQPSVALCRADLAAVSAGITTKLHAVSFEDVPEDVRSVALAREVCGAIRRFATDGDALADHRIHVRCELADDGGLEAALDHLERGATLASLVEHVPGEGQYDDGDIDNRYRTDGASEVLDPVSARMGLTDAVRDRRARRVVAAARRAGVPLASHDDPDPPAVVRAGDLGATICEFPLTLSAARAAARRNVTVVVGAANVARGRSLYGNLDGREAVRDGVVDVLCSDFRPRSLLESLFVDVGSLPERVARVTAEPAAAVGLDDRGRLEPGARADVIVVDADGIPTVDRVVVAGRQVYHVDR